MHIVKRHGARPYCAMPPPTQAGGGGTAFLVSRCHIVTAYHVGFLKARDPVTGKIETLPGKVGQTAEFESMGGTDKLVASYSMAYRNQVVALTAFRKALDGVLRAEGRRALAKRTR
jgi:hypothetical protein